MKTPLRSLEMPSLPNPDEAEQRILAALGCSDSGVTVSDLVVATGLPARRVQETLEQLSREYPCSQAVTESGELLYRFAHNAARRPKGQTAPPALKRAAGRTSGALLRGITRRAPLIFMGGYFALFLTVPFPPALILLAILLSSWSDMGLFDFYGNPRRRGEERVQAPAAMLHEYLFGATGTEEHRKTGELLSTLASVRRGLGFISARDVMSLTGLPPHDAQVYLDELLVRFTGEPTVTKTGRVVYRFPELMKSGAPASSLHSAVFDAPPLADLRGEGIPGRKRRIMTLINTSNLLFSAYYGALALRSMLGGRPVDAPANQIHPGISVLFNAIYSFAAGCGSTCALPMLFLVLGAVPFGITSLYFVLHRRAAHRERAESRAIIERRLRREVYAQVFAHPLSVDPKALVIPRWVRFRGNRIRAVTRILDELAAYYHAEIEDTGDGHYVYHFPELRSEAEELAHLQNSTRRSQFDVGPIVFEARDSIR